MKSIYLVAPFGEDLETISIIAKELSLQKIIIISDKNDLGNAEQFAAKVRSQHMPVEIATISGYSLEELFKIFKSFSEINDKEIIVNAASGNKMVSCLSLSAAFVYGLKAVGVHNGKMMLLPVMKFSYSNMLSDQKLKILKLIHEKDCCDSLEELSDKMNLSFPLVSYHINGSPKSEGLENMGLVEIHKHGKTKSIGLTTLGRMLMNGII